MARLITLALFFFLIHTPKANCETQFKPDSRLAAVRPIPEPTYYRKPIQLRDQTLEGLHYSHSRFQAPLLILSSRITKRSDSNFAQFSAPLNIESALFDRPLSLQLSRYSAPVTIRYSAFNERFVCDTSQFTASFRFFRNNCDERCSFQGARFDGTTECDYNNFSEDALFNRSHFVKETSFTGNAFNKNAHFSQTIFDGPVSFHNGHFTGDVDFEGVTFRDSVRFTETIIGGALNLSHATLYTPLDLTQTKPQRHEQRIPITLTNTDLNKISLNYTAFVLNFPKYTPASEKRFIYEALLHQFAKEGMQQSYKRLYIEYKQWAYADANAEWLSTLSWLWWGYGLKKERILYWSALFLVIFTLINGFLHDSLSTFVSLLSKKESDRIQKLPPMIRYIYCLPQSFIYTLYICFGGIIQFLVIRKYRYNNLWLGFYLFIMFAFGLLCLLFLAQWIISGIFE